MWTGVSLVAIAATTPMAPAYTPVVLEVAVNGGHAGDAVVILRDEAGGLLVPSTELKAAGIRISGAAPVTVEGQDYVRLATLPGLTATLDEATQQLKLTVSAAAFDGKNLAFTGTDQGPMTDATTGFFLNYDLLAEVTGVPLVNGLAELGVFSSAGLGEATATLRWSKAGIGVTRLDTSWTVDFPDGMRSLRLGDSISRGGVGGVPLRFGGIQFGRNFAVQPGFVALPMPTLSGSSALPSVADLYVNGILLGSREVTPGPFTITDLPIITGNGEVRVVVRDLLGRETILRHSYYATPTMLRAGLHDYSYELGLLRRGYARKSFGYGPLMASATHRFGMSDQLTLEAHGEVSASIQTAGGGADLALPGIGLISASAAASRSGKGIGAQAGIGFERQTAAFSISGRADYSSAGYRNLGASDERAPARFNLRASLSLPTSFGSLNASYLRRVSRGEEPDVQYLSANVSVRLGRIGTLHLAGLKSLGGGGGFSSEATLTLPLGRQSSAYAGFQRSQSSQLTTAGFQKNSPAGEGWGYRGAASFGMSDRLDGQLTRRTAFGEYNAELSYADKKLGVRAVASGAVAAIGGEIFVTRRLTAGFATVSVGNYGNVRVYADNHLIARTNKQGKAIVPWLRGYETNVIRIELADLPLNAIVPEVEKSVRPFARSGVALSFAARPSRSALLRIKVQGPGMLPAGAKVRVHGQDFLSAPGGEVFLTDLSASNFVEASWPGESCSFTLEPPPSDDPQPDLGVHFCSPAQVRDGR